MTAEASAAPGTDGSAGTVGSAGTPGTSGLTSIATSAAAFPGDDPRAAARMILGEIPVMPVVPALPDRGLGADRVGRACATLVDLPVDVSPRAWRLGTASGRAARRAADFLERDLDAFEERIERARGAAVDGGSSLGIRAIRIECVGPWSLAARVELPAGRPVLSDAGARRDLAESLREGLGVLAARLHARLGAPVRLVLDESELWHVANGSVPAPSEFDPVAAIPLERLRTALSRFSSGLRAGGGVHSVLVDAPGRPTRGSGPTAWSKLLAPGAGEEPLDGIVLDAADLLAWGGEGSAGSASARPVPLGAAAGTPHGWADGARDPEAFALLDALGTLLSDGGLAELHRPHRLLGRTAGEPRTPAEAELVARRVVTLVDRLGIDRPRALAALTLAAGVDPGSGTLPADGTAHALAAVARTADVLPRIAS